MGHYFVLLKQSIYSHTHTHTKYSDNGFVTL